MRLKYIDRAISDSQEKFSVPYCSLLKIPWLLCDLIISRLVIMVIFENIGFISIWSILVAGLLIEIFSSKAPIESLLCATTGFVLDLKKKLHVNTKRLQTPHTTWNTTIEEFRRVHTGASKIIRDFVCSTLGPPSQLSTTNISIKRDLMCIIDHGDQPMI